MRLNMTQFYLDKYRLTDSSTASLMHTYSVSEKVVRVALVRSDYSVEGASSAIEQFQVPLIFNPISLEEKSRTRMVIKTKFVCSANIRTRNFLKDVKSMEPNANVFVCLYK
eukprot:183800_1